MDVLCTVDLDAFGTDLDDPMLELEQDALHMLIEEPGSNISDLERGLGLEGKLSGAFDASLERQIEAGLQRDPRIDVATVTITAEGRGGYSVSIEIEANGEELGLVFDFDGRVLRKVLN